MENTVLIHNSVKGVPNTVFGMLISNTVQSVSLLGRIKGDANQCQGCLNIPTMC